MITIAASVFSFTATAGNTAFKQALNKVDQGGEILAVYSQSQYYKQLIEKLSAAVPATDQQLQNQMTFRAYKALGIDKVKAHAFSSKEIAPGCWISKTYNYLGKENMAMPNVYNSLATGSDRKLDFLSLPADTIYAASVDVNAATLYNLLYTEYNSKDDKAKQILASLQTTTKRYGIELDKLVASASGTYKILIAATTPGDLLIDIEIPDKHGAFADMIRKTLRLPKTATEATLPLFFMPVKTSLLPGKVRITNEVQRSSTATLAQVPAFANYASRIGSTGTAYMVVNVTPQHTALMRSVMPPQIGSMLQLKPFSALVLTKHDPAGGYIVSAADFSMTSMAYNAGSTIMMGMILPALQNVRENARRGACMNSLRQIAVALLCYADDNKNCYPQANGIAGLQQLIDNDYIAANIFACPGQSVKPVYSGKKLTDACPYIYIGGIIKDLSKETQLGTIPVAFSKPGIHKDKANVAFADGHVQTIIVPGYNTPTQVIGVLSKQYKYNPELLNQMLRAVAEN